MLPKSLLLRIGVLLIYGCLAISCGQKKILCDLPPVLGAEDYLSTSTTNSPTEVFIDATLSMQGFIADGSLSYYQQTIPILERAVIRNGGQINFYKFGTEIQDLPERSYGDAEKKAFYSDGVINKKTLIEKVIDRANPDNLTIIVTDLFQERADINQLSEKIKSKFLTNGRAVGILGIKSQFAGKIFDVGINNYSFAYSSSGESKSLRPFYLLALGNHADIARYFDTLVSGEMSGFPDKQKIIFSKFLTAGPATLSGATISDSRGVNEVNGVMVPSQKGETPYKEFKIKNNVDAATISAQLPYKPLADTMPFEGAKGTVEAFTCGLPDKETEAASSAAVPSPEKASAVGFSAATINNEAIDLKVEIATKKLDSKEVCGYHVIIRPDQYRMPAWINAWNMSGEQIESWKTVPAAFDGSRTYNLEPFLGTLWEINRQVNNPKIADFYTYFRVG